VHELRRQRAGPASCPALLEVVVADHPCGSDDSGEADELLLKAEALAEPAVQEGLVEGLLGRC
jgi:hypothetical protein